MQIYWRIWQWNNFKNWLRFDGVTVLSLVSSFFEHSVVKKSDTKEERKAFVSEMT